CCSANAFRLKSKRFLREGIHFMAWGEKNGWRASQCEKMISYLTFWVRFPKIPRYRRHLLFTNPLCKFSIVENNSLSFALTSRTRATNIALLSLQKFVLKSKLFFAVVKAASTSAINLSA